MIEVEHLAPITVLAEELDVPLVKMRRWADVGRNNGFPQVQERLGNVKYYDRREVARWVYLWNMSGKAKTDPRRSSDAG